MAGKWLSRKLPFGSVFDMFVVRPVVDGSVALNFAGSNFCGFCHDLQSSCQKNFLGKIFLYW